MVEDLLAYGYRHSRLICEGDFRKLNHELKYTLLYDRIFEMGFD